MISRRGNGALEIDRNADQAGSIGVGQRCGPECRDSDFLDVADLIVAEALRCRARSDSRPSRVISGKWHVLADLPIAVDGHWAIKSQR